MGKWYGGVAAVRGGVVEVSLVVEVNLNLEKDVPAARASFRLAYIYINVLGGCTPERFFIQQ